MGKTNLAAAIEMSENIFHPLRVVQLIAETHDTCSLELDVPTELSDRFHYRPGQFLTLRVPSDLTGSVKRCYSLSSAPHEDGPLKITVKRVRDGYGSNWLCDNARAGMVIDVLPPSGRFTPKSLDRDLLLFAGGSGITPILSIMKSVLARGTGKIALIYANRDQQSVIFADELQSLMDRYPKRTAVRHLLETTHGLPTVEALAALMSRWSDREAFVCGPTGFMDVVTATLSHLGTDRRKVHIEKFISLSSDPFDTVAHPQNPADNVSPASLEVKIAGKSHKLSWPRGRTLLDALLDNRIRAPYSCREGACSSCVCQVVSGKVVMAKNDVLESDDLADGLVLACQATPVTDTVSVRYD